MTKKESEDKDGKTIIVMLPTINKAVYEWKTFLSI